MKVLLLSDLDIGYLERTPPFIAGEGTDFIIIVGNISNHPKRTMILAEDTAKSNPDIPVIFGLGMKTFEYNTAVRHIITSVNFRYNVTKIGPPNIHFPTEPQMIGNTMCLSVMGWPRVTKELFETSGFRKFALSEHFQEFYIDDKFISDEMPSPLTYEEYNEKIDFEMEQVQKLNGFSGKKLLISSHPIKGNEQMTTGYVPSLASGIVIRSRGERFFGAIEV